MALDTLDAVLTRVVFHKPGKYDPTGSPFLIARTSSGATIKGTMRKPVEGERYRLYGSWAAQKGYTEPAFEFVTHEVILEEGVAGVVQYLRNYVPGLGLVKATALVEALGADTLRVLRTNPDEALAVHGITPAIVSSIRTHFEEEVEFDPAAFARLVDLFAGHRFPKSVVKSLLRDWGSDAPAKVLENPYMLLAYPRMGWKGVDAFAIDVAGAAYARDGLARQVAAIVEGLERLADDGHTYGTRVEVDVQAFALIAMRASDEAWEAARREGSIVRLNDESSCGTNLIEGHPWCEPDDRPDDADEAFALPKLASAEREIAGHLRRLAGGAEFRLGLAIHHCEGLSDEQRAAVKVIEDNRVSILAGPPGTGKSYTLATVIAALIRDGGAGIRVVAPTGKAAKRAAELLDKACPGHGIECSTIHKALGVAKSDAPEGASSEAAKIGRGRDEFGFQHGEGRPLEVDLLVVDELSMVDCRLMASLLSALATGTRLVLVGDPNQLPSVGPGSVLRDLIAAGVPTATLKTIQRSDGGGRVVRACHAIKDGRVPEPAARVGLPTENWVHLEEDDPARIAATIVELHETARRNGRYDPLWDMQVVSAQRKKWPIACQALNYALGRLLNAKAWGDAADEADGPPFRPGDKVIRRKNGACDEMVPVRLASGAIDVGKALAAPTVPGAVGSPEWFDRLSARELADGSALDALERLEDEEEGRDEPRVDWRWRGMGYALRETAVVNGDMGTIEDVVVEDAGAFAVVRFRNPDRMCRLPMGEHHLELGYALTCHSVQGSGFPYVIVPVHHCFYAELFTRELLYTAISRAEKLLVTVGQFSAARAAIGRPRIHVRRTRLAGLVASRRAVEVAR